MLQFKKKQAKQAYDTNMNKCTQVKKKNLNTVTKTYSKSAVEEMKVCNNYWSHALKHIIMQQNNIKHKNSDESRNLLDIEIINKLEQHHMQIQKKEKSKYNIQTTPKNMQWKKEEKKKRR